MRNSGQPNGKGLPSHTPAQGVDQGDSVTRFVPFTQQAKKQVLSENKYLNDIALTFPTLGSKRLRCRPHGSDGQIPLEPTSQTCYKASP